MKERFFQAVRGVCIIAVIMIHLPDVDSSSGIFDYWLSFRQLINFPVAVFFFLAGYFINPVKIEERGWMASRLKRIGIPYLIWTVAFLGLKIVAKGELLSASEIIMAFLTGGFFHLYYLAVLLQLIVLTPLFMRAVRKNSKIVNSAICLVVVAWLGVRYVLEFWGISIFGTDGLAAFFLTWFCFYYWGMVARASAAKNEAINNSIATNISLLIITLIFTMFESQLIYQISGSVAFATSQTKISSILYAVVFIRFMMAVKNSASITSRSERILASIGDYSFGIYIVYVLFLHVARLVTNGIHIPEWLFLPYQISLTLFTLLASYYAVRYSGQLFGPRWSKYFGLR
jgi:peptidoglycan/LPS O-acetylase OafA/YrhL